MTAEQRAHARFLAALHKEIGKIDRKFDELSGFVSVLPCSKKEMRAFQAGLSQIRKTLNDWEKNLPSSADWSAVLTPKK
jgi:hypothetical protein